MKKILALLLFATLTTPHRSQSAPDNTQLFANKIIVILGGTGFIGRAIIEEVLKYDPAKIIVFSRDEVKHFHLTNMFGNNPKIETMIGDIRDYDSLLKATKSADVVFHAAALKRMDMLESNVQESIKTNVVASVNVFNACTANKVPNVVFISTDKACLPINIYGACKFASEKIFTNYDPKKTTTKCVVARYGNVLESTGSVIPIFTQKIKNGEDIPLTDANMTRFIITKQEAVSLIFDALRYGVGGEIFVTKLSALKVPDLIDVLKEAYNSDNKVKIIGLRPGEKLHEVLINETELARTYNYNNRLIVRPCVDSLYHTLDQELPEYIAQGKHANKEFTKDFSSDQTVLTKDQLAELFKELGLTAHTRNLTINEGIFNEENTDFFDLLPLL